MLHAHRDLDSHTITIYTEAVCKTITLTENVGFPVADIWRGSSGVPTLTWSTVNASSVNSPRKHITSISRLKTYFSYTEPEYTRHIKNWLNVHPNQYQAATEILECFYCGIQNVILTAEMQSGKTGTSRYIVHSLLHHSGPSAEFSSKMVSENMYFICGMNDNDLRNQAIKEFAGLIPAKNILFSKQLQMIKESDKMTPCLVIVDESHYASNVNSLVDKFLKHIPGGHLLLSVSATAMAELATSVPKGKAMVYLRPGDNYYSIRDIFQRGLVHQSVNISANQKDFIELVAEEYEHQMSHGELKYNIIRIPNQWYFEDLEEEIRELGLDVNFINHHASAPVSGRTSVSAFTPEEDAKITDFNDYINNEPLKFTIIWIYGSLRAGKQLNTRHIGFVHDTADSAPDTIAQSLLGRILGYNKRNNHVKCYTDVKSAKLMCEWMTNIYDITKIPSGSRGIVHGYIDKVKKWQLHPPMAVMLDEEARAYFRYLKQKHGNRYPYKQEFIETVVKSSEGTSSEDLMERVLETYEPGRCGGLMILTETNADRTFNDYWAYNYNSWVNQTPVRGFDVLAPGKYYYIYANLNINSPEYGVVLVTRKEYLNSKPEASYAAVKSNSRFS